MSGTLAAMDPRGQWAPVDASVVPDEPVVPTSGRRQGARWGRVVIWCALLAVMAGAVAVVVLRDPPRSPDEELARIRAFVASAVTGRFEGSSRSEQGSGADEPGSTSIDVTRIDGSFALPDRIQVVEDSGGYVFETIGLATGSYFRSADERSELDSERWTYEAPVAKDSGHGIGDLTVEGLDPDGSIALSAASGVLGAFGAPFDLARLLDRLDGVRRVSPGVLEAIVTMRQLLPAETVRAIEQSAEAELQVTDGKEADDEDGEWGASVDDFLDGTVTVRLVHADDGELQELDITTETGAGEERSVDRTSLRFSGWGQPVSIAAPAGATVDLTPGVDEEDLAAFDSFRVLAPAAPPPGMVLQYASVTDGDEEEETCPSAELGYGAPSPSDGSGVGEGDALDAYLRVTVVASACPWANDEVSFFAGTGEPQTVQVGPYAGELWQLRFPGDGADEAMLNVRFTVGDVVVGADTNLPPEQALMVLSSVAPLDLATQPVERSEPPGGR